MENKTYYFSYYKPPVKNTKPEERPVTLESLRDEIKQDKHKAITEQYRQKVGARDAVKNDPEKYAPLKDEVTKFKATHFPYVTPNGIFSNREEKGLLILSGLCIVDVDHVQPDKLPSLKERLTSDEKLPASLIFRSPSGDGLKIFYTMVGDLVATTGSKRNVRAIDAVNSYFAAHYSDLITPANDKAGKPQYVDFACTDVSRACFICYDSDVYFMQVDYPVITTEFCQQWPPLKTTKEATKEKERQDKDERARKVVSPKTGLHTLAERHLIDSDNHHANIIEFTGAAKNLGHGPDVIFDYLQRFVHISHESAHHDPEKLRKEVWDICERYANKSDGAVLLTALSFAYDVFYFRWSKEANNYVLQSLYREGVKNKLHKMGFGKRYISGNGFVFVQQLGPILKQVATPQIRDEFMSFINGITDNLVFEYQGKPFVVPVDAAHETFNRDSNNIFNNTWLEHLQNNTTPILKDGKNELYFVFQNCVVTVKRSGDIEAHQLNEFSGYVVWEEQVIKRNFEYVDETENCHWSRFISNICNNDTERTEAMQTIIGYLLHNHFSPSDGQAVICYDEHITDTRKPMGGTGKGLFAQGLGEMRDMVKIDGKHFRNESPFKWSLVTPSTQVVWLDDVRAEFDFEVLHTNLTDGWQVEKKNVNTINIPPEESPKTLIASNRVLKAEGRTNVRRQYILEFSDHYARHIIKGDEKPIIKEHGCIFFSQDWDAMEWNCFYSYMVNAAARYMVDGVKTCKPVNIEINRIRQKTSDEFLEWCDEKNFEPGTEYDTAELFKEFRDAEHGPDDKSFHQRRFSDWLKSFATFKGWEYKVRRGGGKSFFTFSICL